MPPLTLDDLVPLAEFVARRAEFFDAHRRYCERYRRVRIGPSITLLFENRQTLCFRVQEVMRIARLTEPELVQIELDWYNQLLPTRDRLQAAMLMDNNSSLAGFSDDAIRLVLGETMIPAKVLTSRPADRAAGAGQWLEFALPAPMRQHLRNRRLTARIEIHAADYRHDSAYLSDDIRQSLLDDLKMSQHDAA